jgi:hypothetical protein
MRAGSECAARVDHDLGDARPHGRLLPRRPDVQAAAHEDGHMEALPALGPVVRHLLAADPNPASADVGFALRQRRQLAGCAVERVLDPTGAVDLLEAGRRELEQRGEDGLGVVGGGPYGQPDQRNARLTFANSPSAFAASRLRASSVADSRSSRSR